MEFGKLHAYSELMCPLENCQWCGEPRFAGAAISIDVLMPQIPRQDRHVIADLMRSLWRVNLMLVLSHSVLNRGYILMNVLKALASIVFMRSLRAIFLLKITLRYFMPFTNGMSSSVQCTIYKPSTR
jgi:hypothetical protein